MRAGLPTSPCSALRCSRQVDLRPVVELVVGPLARASDFAQGARGYGQEVAAPELRQRLGLAQ